MQIAQDLIELDRRTEPRHQVSIEGVVIDAQNTTRKFDCIISDLSENGAKIMLNAEAPLPDRVMVFECYNGNIFECEVRWRRGADLGVRFLDTCGRDKRRALIEECSLEIVQEIPALRRYVFCLTGSVAVTNDVMPIVRAFTKRPALFGVPSARQNIYRALNNLIVADEPQAPLFSVIEDLHKSILSLPLQERKALLLSYTMNFSISEIAFVLTMTEEEAHDTVERAFVQLNRIQDGAARVH